MAGEITGNLNLNLAIGTAPYNVSDISNVALTYDSSTSLADKVVKSCSTSDTSLTALFVNTATIEGLLYVKNLDNTNYVTLGPTSGGAIVPMVRLNAGKAALIPLVPGLTLRAQANTAACKVEFKLFAGNSTSGA